MKIALYIEDGREQIVLTPDTKTERAILARLHDGTRIMSLYHGTFYGCRGGWTRWEESEPTVAQFRPNAEEDRSTIIVLDKKEEGNVG